LEKEFKEIMLTRAQTEAFTQCHMKIDKTLEIEDMCNLSKIKEWEITVKFVKKLDGTKMRD
jgi:hypothetical protein